MKAGTVVTLAAAGALLMGCSDSAELTPEVAQRVDTIEAQVQQLGAELGHHTATMMLAVEDMGSLAAEEGIYSEAARWQVSAIFDSVADLRPCVVGSQLALDGVATDATAMWQELARHRLLMAGMESVADGLLEERKHHDAMEELLDSMQDWTYHLRIEATNYNCRL